MSSNPGGTTEEQIAFISTHIMDKEAMAATMQEAVANGIKAAVADPAFWNAAGAAMQQRAESSAAGWLLGTIRAAFSKVGMGILLLLGLYLIGGWGALISGIKAIVGSHP